MAVGLAGAMSASASITYSGAALSGLTPSTPYGPVTDSRYVPASGSTPALWALYTSDSGDLNTSGDDPAVFVQGPLGTLSSFSASYHLYVAATGPSAPYFILWVNAPGDPSDLIGIIGMGGPTLDGSSAIHVVDSYNSYANSTPSYWGDSLSTLDNTTYARTGVTFGQMTVDWAGVEIGNWDNGTLYPVPASANIDSITIGPVPEPTTMIAGALLLLPFGASTFRILRKNRAA